MLQITKQASYALQAAMEVARHDFSEPIPTATVAEAQDIPRPFLAKIVTQLATHNIIKASRGSTGGISLARNADSITVRAIIEAIDGPILLCGCTSDGLIPDHSSTCVLHEVFQEAQQSLLNDLDAITLADLAARFETLQAKAESQSARPAARVPAP